MLTLTNLTPHIINIHLPSGEVVSIPPSGEVARVSTTETPLPPLRLPSGEVIPVVETGMGEVEGLPPPSEGEVNIVSRIVLEAVKGTRGDCVAPGPLVRDSSGRPIGCKGLSR